MEIIVKTKNIKLDEAQLNHIRRTMARLEKFSRPFRNEKRYFGIFKRKQKDAINLQVLVGRESRHHKKGFVFIAEAKLRLPGRNLEARERSEDIRNAVDAVCGGLERELKRAKGKTFSLEKRRQRILKKAMRLSPFARFYRKGRIREEGM